MQMKSITLPLLTSLFLLSLLTPVAARGQTETPIDGYRLVWSEEFDGESINPSIWSMVPKGEPDWCRHMTSDYPHLIEVSEGTLKLRADYDEETGEYITAGIWSKDKKSIPEGRIDVRARYDSGRGFWPAIWMVGQEREDLGWPDNGEIDIMEHLNSDSIVYQTVHTPLTVQEGYDGPAKGGTIEIDTTTFNVYSVVITKDEIRLLVNDRLCHVFPRLGDDPKQFPYAYYPLNFILSAQIGGAWVGEPVPPAEPLELEIDYVRHYLPEKEHSSVVF